MIRFLTLCLLSACALEAREAPRGFGEKSRGGAGGRVIHVTRLDDHAKSPPVGSFRWAVMQKGPRIVKFAIAGNIELRDRIVIREPRITIDGSDAPALGVCLKGGSLEFRDTHDIIVRHIRVRLGDGPGLRANRLPLRWRPANSRGLDCINLLECDRVLIEHCSLSWSCDEIVSVVRCRGVTVQWCILSEPLRSWRLHPYGDNHAYCLNASASTLSVHHCLFAHYVMRGPQFEANDMRRGDAWEVRMEAVGNLMCDYKSSGSRYTTGVEDPEAPSEDRPPGLSVAKQAFQPADRRTAEPRAPSRPTPPPSAHRPPLAVRTYQFQFIGNHYLGSSGRPAIQANTSHGFHPGVQVASIANIALAAAGMQPCDARALIETDKKKPVRPGTDGAGKQLRAHPLFTTTASANDPRMNLEHFFQNVGCSLKRDAVDARIVSGAPWHRQKTITSPAEVGGWPALHGREPQQRAARGITRKVFGRPYSNSRSR